MSPNAVPSRITIDFRDTAMPSRTWILGVDDRGPDRLELITFERQDAAPTAQAADRRTARRPAPSAGALVAECACPEFCERDHANE
jgi:hypothetical protein